MSFCSKQLSHRTLRAQIVNNGLFLSDSLGEVFDGNGYLEETGNDFDNAIELFFR
jgi:hypothetical protein